LVGFMAAGKTTVARALAKRLGWLATDIDELIEARERLAVAEIFSRHGEPYFRAAERDVLSEQFGVRNVVVATGGGTFVDPQNRALINRDGVSVWLDVPLEQTIARLPANGRRPLAADRTEFERLYQFRRTAAMWPLAPLTPAHRAWLAALPAGPHVVDDVVEICHGSPVDEDAYIFDELDALRALKASRRPLCLFGHTHYAVTFELADRGPEGATPSASAETQITLRRGSKYLVNPGSVGQPRDGDPRASYAIVDTVERRVELFRQSYPVE